MAQTPRILIIDDDEANRALLRLLIVGQWPDTQLSEVHDALSLARAMRSPVQDLCVVDPETTWTDSEELLKMLCNDPAMGSVVVYSTSDQAESAIRAVRAGAATYLVKDAQGPVRLIQELTRWLGPGTMQSDPRSPTVHVLEQTIAMVAHDLQEPIRAVQNYLDVLTREHGKELSEDAQGLVELAKTSTEHAMQGLRDGIKELHDPQSAGAPSDMNLPLLELDEDEESVEATTAWNKDVVRFPEVVTNAEVVLEETLEILAPTIEREGARIERESLVPVAVQSIHLRRILQNLIGNALKFRTTEAPHIRIGCSEDENLVRITVRDNGIGIDAEHHKRIFEMFSRVQSGKNYPGTGIGLAAVKNLVESYGGTIDVESTPGHGSCFEFTIPSIPGSRVRASRKN